MHSYLRDNPLVFVDDIHEPEISKDDYKHLTKSLRMSNGEPIAIGDGKGSWCQAKLSQKPQKTGKVTTVDQQQYLHIGFVPTKSTKPDWLVKKLVELKVSRISVLFSDHSVVRWDPKKSEDKFKRLKVIVKQAAMQSKQLIVPELDQPMDLNIFLKNFSGGQPVFADPTGRKMNKSDSCILIGPEGGFTSEEFRDYDLVSLPGGILRSETAVLTAAIGAQIYWSL